MTSLVRARILQSLKRSARFNAAIRGRSSITATGTVNAKRTSTGVTSTSNLQLVRSIGAHHVIDYTVEDFMEAGETWDIILDTTGTALYARVAIKTLGEVTSPLEHLARTDKPSA